MQDIKWNMDVKKSGTPSAINLLQYSIRLIINWNLATKLVGEPLKHNVENHAKFLWR